jgi:hypothetical protein
MSDNNNSTGLGAFLTKFTAPIAGIIAFITSLNGFFKLFADKDAGLITIISLVVGILLLLGICFYYARFWKRRIKDATGFLFQDRITPDLVSYSKCFLGRSRGTWVQKSEALMKQCA